MDEGTRRGAGRGTFEYHLQTGVQIGVIFHDGTGEQDPVLFKEDGVPRTSCLEQDVWLALSDILYE